VTGPESLDASFEQRHVAHRGCLGPAAGAVLNAESNQTLTVTSRQAGEVSNHLTNWRLQPIVGEARQLWIATGLNAGQQAALNALPDAQTNDAEDLLDLLAWNQAAMQGR
jgi:hypothetical protein